MIALIRHIKFTQFDVEGGYDRGRHELGLPVQVGKLKTRSKQSFQPVNSDVKVYIERL
jgi:hypothetical protein